MTTAALDVLRATGVLGTLPEPLLEELAAAMTPVEAEAGRVFAEEGEEMKQVLVVESGRLVRTKLAAETIPGKEITNSVRGLVVDPDHSVLVDEMVGSYPDGRAAITGALHNFTPGNAAYATITAKGPCKVWTLGGDDFRAAVSKPEYALAVMDALSRIVRNERTSLRTLMDDLREGTHGEGGRADDGKTLRVQCYDATTWVVDNFSPAVEAYNAEHAIENGGDGFQIRMDYTAERLSETTATFAAGYDAVCVFVNDAASEKTIQILSSLGVRMIASRCMGFDRIATKAALAYGVTVARVPSYSPYAVAEHAMSLFCALNRKVHKADARVRMGNFALDGGLVGMDVHGKTVAVMGTGQIGRLLCNIILGFGANLLCYDIFENEELKKKGGQYVSQDEIYERADVIFLFMPLLPATKHTINAEVLPKLKRGVVLVNSSRGGLVDTEAVLKGVKEGIIGGYATDVYENEGPYFFQDWSGKAIPDDALLELMGSNKVLMTAHQAFFTQEAIDDIVRITLENLNGFQNGKTMYEHPNNYLPRK